MSSVDATRTPDPVVVYDTTLIYDIASNTWSTGAAMPAPRYQMAAGYNSADGMIYLNGGFETSTIDSVQATTWKYDPVANTFTVKTPSPQMQAGMATGIVNGHLLIAGGRTNPDATLVATWDYDIASDSWTQKQDMMQPTNVPGSAVALSKLWSFGGCTTTPCNPFDGIPTVESFDPVANTWSSEASLNHAAIVPRRYGDRQHAVRRGRPRRPGRVARHGREAGPRRTATSSATTTASTSAAASASASASASTASASASASAAAAATATSATSATSASASGSLPCPESARAASRMPRSAGSGRRTARSATSAAFARGARCAAAW